MPHIEGKYRIAPGTRRTRDQRDFDGRLRCVAFCIRASGTIFGGERAVRRVDDRFSTENSMLHLQTGVPLLSVLAPVFGKPIDVRHWNENNPLMLAQKNAAGLRKIAIYFNCGQNDNYGFEKGAAELHEEFEREHVKHEYHAYPGDHSLHISVALRGSHGIPFQGLWAGALSDEPSSL